MDVAFGLENTKLTAEPLPDVSGLLLEALQPFTSSRTPFEQQADEERIGGTEAPAPDPARHERRNRPRLDGGEADCC